MYRKEILAYEPTCPQEAADKAMMLEYIDRFPDTILLRENKWAHMTASGFIVNADVSKVLFVHHNLYRVWAWTGGHADGESDMLKLALKEAWEETGAQSLRPLRPEIASMEILAVWGHEKRGQWVSGHQHLNVSYVLVADEDDTLQYCPEENSGVAWIAVEDMSKLANEWQMDPIYAKLLKRAREWK